MVTETTGGGLIVAEMTLASYMAAMERTEQKRTHRGEKNSQGSTGVSRSLKSGGELEAEAHGMTGEWAGLFTFYTLSTCERPEHTLSTL